MSCIFSCVKVSINCRLTPRKPSSGKGASRTDDANINSLAAYKALTNKIKFSDFIFKHPNI